MHSISVNRILANHDNAAATAAIAASAQRASTDIRLIGQRRAGGGRMTLAGAYEGEADSTVEVEILDGAGASLCASTPVINGVGNGRLTIAALDIGALPETLTFTLADAGSPAEFAVLDFFGAQLAARAPGEAGNALSIEVARNLATTPMPYTTLETITAGSAELEGAAWHWGQPAGAGAGIPPTALRVQFEGFPQVHRAWKTWRDGAFVFHLDPAPAWDIPADTRVLAVSGGYTLTVSDGATSEVYADVVTVYDFLTALRARSALVEVRGAIAVDTAPGGMGVTDIPLRTDAQALPATIKVASGKLAALTGITVQPDAPTENIVISYVGAAAGGGNAWAVEGGISGALPNALTGVPYAHGPVGFTIPVLATSGVIDTARIRARFDPTSRQDGEGLPGICFKPLLLGAQPQNKTVTFTYRKKPTKECPCDNLPAQHVSLTCLGLADGGDAMALNPEIQSRLIRLYEWRTIFFSSNTYINQLPVAVRQDLDFADMITEVFAGTLESIHASPIALAKWDEYYVGMTTELDILLGTGGAMAQPFPEATTLQGGKVGSIYYNTHNRHYYRLIDATYAGTTEEAPTLPFNYLSYEGAASPSTFEAFPLDSPLWTTDYSVTTLRRNRSTWNTTFYGAVLHYQDMGRFYFTNLFGQDNLVLVPDENGSYDSVLSQLVRRYKAMMDLTLALAGVVPDPKTEASSVAGHACWRDYPSKTHWWVDETGEYLPVFTNTPYVSAVLDCSLVVGTQEFGLGVVTQCEHRIKEGDSFTITIGGAGAGTGAYANGDSIVIPIIGAAGAAFAGGAGGDAMQTWAVRGSRSGDLPDWLWRPGAPTPYADGPITAELAAGAIPFEVGDAIHVALEGGRMRWRRDGGAWAEGDLFGPAHGLGEGLTLAATPGATPSFVAGDTWRFQAVATHGVSRLRRPRIGQAYAWDGASTVLDIDLGDASDIEAVTLALHTLPATVVITISGGELAADEWALTPVWRDGPIVAPLPAPRAVRFLRVRIDGAGAGASIGWLWAGMGWQPTVGASELTQARQYGMARGSGINPGALYRGRGMGGRWVWRVDDGAALESGCADALLALVDHVAEQGVEPVCLVADIREPERASLALLDADEVSFIDHINWQHAGNRAVSVDLPFRAVLG